MQTNTATSNALPCPLNTPSPESQARLPWVSLQERPPRLPGVVAGSSHRHRPRRRAHRRRPVPGPPSPTSTSTCWGCGRHSGFHHPTTPWLAFVPGALPLLRLRLRLPSGKGHGGCLRWRTWRTMWSCMPPSGELWPLRPLLSSTGFWRPALGAGVEVCWSGSYEEEPKKQFRGCEFGWSLRVLRVWLNIALSV